MVDILNRVYKFKLRTARDAVRCCETICYKLERITLPICIRKSS